MSNTIILFTFLGYRNRLNILDFALKKGYLPLIAFQTPREFDQQCSEKIHCIKHIRQTNCNINTQH